MTCSCSTHRNNYKINTFCLELYFKNMSEQQQQQQSQGKHFLQKHNMQKQLEMSQNQSNKSNKDQTPVIEQHVGASLTSTTASKKLNVHEMRNQDFINRLMAAMPPYIYSPTIGNNYFFSDMLRGLVAARQSENMRHLQMQQQHQQQQQQQAASLARRSRKRLWSAQNQPYFDNLRDSKEMDEKKLQQPAIVSKLIPPLVVTEKPLELTNKSYTQFGNACPRKLQLQNFNHDHEQNKLITDQKENIISQSTMDNESNQDTLKGPITHEGDVNNLVKNTLPPPSLPSQELVLPPPQPVWYPPLYPPYAFDPLHFFIDLRVSGHIYDRKKDSGSPLSNSVDNQNSNTESEVPVNAVSTTVSSPTKQRHGSAFTVPTPRSADFKNLSLSPDVLNLSANTAKYYDLTESKENNNPFNKHNANYMLQQLPRLYSQFANSAERNSISENIDGISNNNDNISSIADNRSDFDGADDSDGRASISIDNSIDNLSARDIDVEIVDSIKYRTEIDSHCSSDTSITQID